MLHDFPPFPGIRDEALAFLEALKDDANQNREWFNARKHLYTDELRGPMQHLVADVLRRIGEFSEMSLYGDPKKSVFRIYRDVRFSNDKRPYKRHIACRFTVDPGFHLQDGLVYVHIEPPDQFFLAAGIHQPPVKRLRPIRMQLVGDPSPWRDVAARLEEEELTLTSHGEGLQSLPRGFAEYADHENAHLLKWTSLLVVEELPRARVQSPGFTDDVVSFTRRAWPLLAFIRDAR